MSGVHTAMTNTLDTPVEALERALPLRVRRYGLRRGSGGAGAHPGGDGIWRELEALAPTEVSLITERRVTAAARTRRRRARRGGGELAAPRRRRVARATPPRQVHRAPRRRRRAARAHPRRWGMGTALLDHRDHARVPRRRCRVGTRASVAVTVSICSAPSSMRRRPLVMRCSRSATNRASRYRAGVERPADHLQPLDPHVARVGGRERGELGRAS